MDPWRPQNPDLLSETELLQTRAVTVSLLPPHLEMLFAIQRSCYALHFEHFGSTASRSEESGSWNPMQQTAAETVKLSALSAARSDARAKAFEQLLPIGWYVFAGKG
mmetsp:Transcript_103480/g.179659  ORF Transcript_103480/g.179659 Transcript_103480/m.179659 type:complete len:107 (-) Transcript_103480:126-446(-)